MPHLRLLLIPLSLLFISFNTVASESIQQNHFNKVKGNCLTLMPCPKQLHKGEGSFILRDSPRLYISGLSEKRKQAALQHIEKQLKKVSGYNFKGFIVIDDEVMADITLLIEPKNQQVTVTSLPRLGVDESYQLSITKQGIRIQAQTDFGALHGLTSLVQLIAMPEQEAKPAQMPKSRQTTQLIPKLATQQLPHLNIIDEPRFKWRGLLIDSVRHFIPLEIIKRQLDGMAAAKLNVFHWHLTDDQGWRIESKTYPKLHQLASDGLYYTQQDIKELVTYASNLGIRVVPEFDLPGHASAIAVAYPELITEKNSYAMERHWGVFEPLLDVANPKAYQFIDTLISELTQLFPDEYLHIGGDEVNPKQWQESADINALMLKHNMKDAYDLHSFFNVKLQTILAKHNRKMMGWDEILHQDLPKDIVVQSWRGLESLNVIAGSGYQALLSAGYYIDQPQKTSYHYRNDPLANIALANQTANEVRIVNMKADEHWQTWSFTMPRLKGSAVKGSLTLISDEKANQFSGYVKLNDHHHKKITIHSSLNDLQDNQVIFSHDSWMGPMHFELSLSADGTLSGFTLVGNSYYPIDKKDVVKYGEVDISLQQLLAVEQAKNILGGEATLWSEMVDERNIDLRTWPRLFAISERFWSSKELKNSDNMYQRLMVIDDYAADVVGLQHQAQQKSGFEHLIREPVIDNSSTEKASIERPSAANITQDKPKVAMLFTLAEALEPAHYYTRHHIKYQQNEYHQNAALDNFVDYLAVESYSLLAMQDDLTDYQLGDKSALLKMKNKLSRWRENSKKLSLLINEKNNENKRLTAILAIVPDLHKFNTLALSLVERCIADELYNNTEASALDHEFIALQNKSNEIVIAGVPLARRLLNHCQMKSE